MLIKNYRARALTQSKDRIMAFAGIAQAVQRSSQLSYTAGAWKEAFPFSLTWHVVFSQWDITAPAVRETVTAVAPSWSWFSLPIFSRHELDFVPNDILRRHLRFSEKNSIETMFEASLLCTDGVPLSANTFHDFTGLDLHFSTKTGSMSPGTPGEKYRQSKTIESEFKRHLGTQPSRFTFYRDRPKEAIDWADATVALLFEARYGHETGFSRSYGDRILIGLVMMREPGGAAYRRTGLWTLNVEHHPAGWKSNGLKLVSIFDQLHGVFSESISLV